MSLDLSQPFFGVPEYQEKDGYAVEPEWTRFDLSAQAHGPEDGIYFQRRDDGLVVVAITDSGHNKQAIGLTLDALANIGLHVMHTCDVEPPEHVKVAYERGDTAADTHAYAVVAVVDALNETNRLLYELVART